MKGCLIQTALVYLFTKMLFSDPLAILPRNIMGARGETMKFKKQNQHGAWAMVFMPLVIGMVAGGFHPAQLFYMAGWLMIFFMADHVLFFICLSWNCIHHHAQRTLDIGTRLPAQPGPARGTIRPGLEDEADWHSGDCACSMDDDTRIRTHHQFHVMHNHGNRKGPMIF